MTINAGAIVTPSPGISMAAISTSMCAQQYHLTSRPNK
jgi:hypothetical protein